MPKIDFFEKSAILTLFDTLVKNRPLQNDMCQKSSEKTYEIDKKWSKSAKKVIKKWKKSDKKWSKNDKKCEKNRVFSKKNRVFSTLREIAPVKCHIRKGPEIRGSKNDPKSAKICQNGQK